MAAKPTSLPEWATDETNNDEPSAGQKATGWTPGQDGVSDWDNWYKKLVFDWTAYLNDGALEGDHSIDLNLTVGGTTTTGVLVTQFGGTVPQVHVKIPDGASIERTRYTIDHLGFPIGEWSEWVEDWRDGDGITPPVAWTVGGAGVVTFGGPSELGPGADTVLRTRVARLRCTNALDQADLIGPYIATITDDNAFVIEGQVRTDLGAIDVGDALRMTWGIRHRHAGADDWFVTFFNDNDVDGSWQAQIIGNAGTVNFDTGVAVAANTVYRFRIEIIGDSLHAGADFLIRWFINGQLEHSTTTNDIDVDDIGPYMSTNCPTNEAGDYDFYVGRVKCAWNHLLDQSQL